MNTTDEESGLINSRVEVKGRDFGFERLPWDQKFGIIFSYLVLVAYMIGTPLWSYIFNVQFGFEKLLCTTDARDIECGNYADFYELVKNSGRQPHIINGKEVYTGCSCGQGFFAESLCPVVTHDKSGWVIGAEGFSLSYYIGTAPATGAMAAASVWPIMYATRYGFGSIDSYAFRKLFERQQFHGADIDRLLSVIHIITSSWKVFITTYAVFLMFTYCVLGILHEIFVGAFIVALITHWFAVVYLVYLCKGKRPMEYIVVGIAAVGIVAFVTGIVGERFVYVPEVPRSLDHTKHSNLNGYGFWLGEVLGLSCAFAMTPALVLFDRDS